jgi:lycopene cyclase domain-containing protein
MYAWGPTYHAIVSTMLVLMIADIIGIRAGIFFTKQAYVSGLYIGTPNFPIEELVLLFFLPYLTTVLYSYIKK